ncbi:MAG: LPS export ABC transporter periplasmic protein LptC [Pseudomonadota bacterium]|jgi:lipopolysaccharide export system protein LptC
MKDRFAAGFPLALLFLLAALTFWLDRAVQAPQAKRDGSGRHDMDYSVENFTMTRMGKDGAPQHTLAAAKMVHYPDDDSTHLTNPHYTRLDKEKPPLHIRAQRGLVSSNGEHVYFTGGVQVVREAGRGKDQVTAATEFLHVIPDKDLALTDKAVTIRTPTVVMTAVGLELNNKTHTMKLLSRVKGHYEKTAR